MSEAEENGKIPEESIEILDDSAIRGSNAFIARKYYYVFRSILYLFLYVFLVLAVLGMLTAVGIGIWVNNCHSQISMENAKKARATQLAGWLAFSHLESQTPEVRAKLLKKYESRMKALDRKDLNSPVIARSLPYIKQLAQSYSEGRSQKMNTWANDSRKHSALPPYKIVKISKGNCILSEDVLPTELLVDEIAEKEQLRTEGKLPSNSDESRIEANIRVLAKEWFIRQMEDYDQKPESEKAAFLAESAETLNHFSALYNKALSELGLPAQGEVEQLRDLNYLISGWDKTTSPEELAKLYWFKDLIISAGVVLRTSKSADSLEHLIRYSENEKKPSLLKAVLGSSQKNNTQKSETNSSPAQQEPAETSSDNDFF